MKISRKLKRRIRAFIRRHTPQFIKEQQEYKRLSRTWEEAYRFPRQEGEDLTRSGHLTFFFRAQDEEQELKALLAENTERIREWLASGSNKLSLQRLTGSCPEQQKPSVTAKARRGNTVFREYMEIYAIADLVKDDSRAEGYRMDDILCDIEHYIRRDDVAKKRQRK